MVAEQIVFEEEEAAPEPRAWRWSADDYHELGRAGWFDGKRVELIGGEIITMAPIGGAHWTGTNKATAYFHKLFTSRFIVSTQSSLRLSRHSEPEPDIALVEGDWDDYKENLPTTAALIVEMSDATLRYDRTTKASLYASAGIADYWVVNLKDEQLEVLREPVEKPDQPFGWGYRAKTIYRRGEVVAPLAAPEVAVSVADLLP